MTDHDYTQRRNAIYRELLDRLSDETLEETQTGFDEGFKGSVMAMFGRIERTVGQNVQAARIAVEGDMLGGMTALQSIHKQVAAAYQVGLANACWALATHQANLEKALEEDTDGSGTSDQEGQAEGGEPLAEAP